jgi:hypothetical protein
MIHSRDYNIPEVNGGYIITPGINQLHARSE